MELGCMLKQQAQCRILKYALIEENILPSYATHYFYEIKAVPGQHMSMTKYPKRSFEKHLCRFSNAI